MIVLAGREAVYIFFCLERWTAILRCAQVLNHNVAISSGLQSQIYTAAFARIEQVITFVLGVVHSELLANVFRPRMHLQRQISSAHGIEKVEADGEFGAEARKYIFSEQFERVKKGEINRGQFDLNISEPEQ